MGYKGLITLDLPSSSDEQRKKFYESLENEKWIKIDNLTTAWKVSFKDDIERAAALNILKKELSEAKTYSSVSKLNCSIQLGKGQLYIDN